MASIRETLTLAAYVLRSIVTVNPSGVAGDPVFPVHGVGDAGGNLLGIGGNPLTIIQSGTTGTDYSANAATVPMPGLVLLITIPATPARAFVEVQNQSAAALQFVRDDGNGGNQTSILLAPVGAGQQGAGWSSSTFKGRARVYGAPGSQVAGYQE